MEAETALLSDEAVAATVANINIAAYNADNGFVAVEQEWGHVS